MQLNDNTQHTMCVVHAIPTDSDQTISVWVLAHTIRCQPNYSIEFKTSRIVIKRKKIQISTHHRRVSSMCRPRKVASSFVGSCCGPTRNYMALLEGSRCVSERSMTMMMTFLATIRNDPTEYMRFRRAHN